MTVSIQDTKVEYTANGNTSEFSFGFRVVLAKDLVVTVNKEQVADTAYTLSGVGSGSGGVVIFNTAPEQGDTVVIYRKVVLERYTDYQRNGDFLAKTVNEDFDRLMMVGQDGNSKLALCLQHDILGENYDAQSRIIENLADPEKDTDGATKQYVDTYAMVRADTETDTPLDAKGLRISNVADASADSDATSKGYVDKTINQRVSDINSFDQTVADTMYVRQDGTKDVDHINVTNTAKAKDVEASKSVKIGTTTLTGDDGILKADDVKLLKNGDAVQLTADESGVKTVAEPTTFSGDTNFTGALQNKGSDVITKAMNVAYVTEAFLSNDGLSGYEKWSNGKIVQWGRITTTGGIGSSSQINLLYPIINILAASFNGVNTGADSSVNTYTSTLSNNGDYITLYKAYAANYPVIWSITGMEK